MAQNPPCGARNDDGYEQGEGEAEGTVLHAVDEVHAEERRDQGGEHHDDTHGGERTHHGVHVVVDDTGVGVHRRFEDVGIDAGGLARLAHLDVDVLDEVGVELIDLELELQFGQQVFVAADGGDEVGERVLEPGESDQALVVDLLVEVLLRLLDQGVDLLESFQVPYGGGEEEAEDHVHIVREALAALLLVADEVDHHVGLEVADRDGDVALVDDAEGDGGVGRAGAYLLDVGDAEDDEHPAVVILIAGPLVGIGDVGEEIIGYLEPLLQFLLVLLRGTSDLYPAIGLPL